MPELRPLKVFLCHATEVKPKVRDLYRRLTADGAEVWLDEVSLLPGQDWRVEIPIAVRAADAVIVCLTSHAADKEGYIQKEIRFALDAAEEKPDGTIYIIPAKLEDCRVPPRLTQWQWANLFDSDERGYNLLLTALKVRAEKGGVSLVSHGTAPYQQDEAKAPAPATGKKKMSRVKSKSGPVSDGTAPVEIGFQMKRKVKVTINTLNVRSGPGFSNPIVGTTQKGQILEITREVDGWGEIGLDFWVLLTHTEAES